MERKVSFQESVSVIGTANFFSGGVNLSASTIAWGFDTSGLAKMKLWTWGKFFQL